MKIYEKPKYQILCLSIDVITTSGIPNTDAQEDFFGATEA